MGEQRWHVAPRWRLVGHLAVGSGIVPIVGAHAPPQLDTHRRKDMLMSLHGCTLLVAEVILGDFNMTRGVDEECSEVRSAAVRMGEVSMSRPDCVADYIEVPSPAYAQTHRR